MISQARSAHAQGCTKQPLFGVAGIKKIKFCAGHACDGMVDFASGRCAHPRSSKFPPFRTAHTETKTPAADMMKKGCSAS